MVDRESAESHLSPTSIKGAAYHDTVHEWFVGSLLVFCDCFQIAGFAHSSFEKGIAENTFGLDFPIRMYTFAWESVEGDSRISLSDLLAGGNLLVHRRSKIPRSPVRSNGVFPKSVGIFYSWSIQFQVFSSLSEQPFLNLVSVRL